MVVKVKEKYDMTRHIEKMINLKNTIYEEKEMEHNMIEFCLIQEKDNKSFILRFHQKFLQKQHWPTF